LSGLRFQDGKTQHPDNIPKASGFILAGHVRGNGHINVKRGAGDENRKADSGFLCGFRYVNLHAVGNGLARV
jgi:hypothetical protein